MADSSLTPFDLGDIEIPVVDAGGKAMLIQGDKIQETKAPAGFHATPTAAAAKSTFATITPEIEREAAAQAAKSQATKFTPGAVDPFMAAVSRKVDEAVAFCGSYCPTGDLRQRFRSLVETYFRDLRDAAETKARLLLPADKGGMGMGESDAEQAMARLKSKAQEYRQALENRAAEEKRGRLESQAKSAEETQDAAAAREKFEMDRRFAALTQKTGKPMQAPPAPPKPMQPPKVIPVVGLDKKPELAIEHKPAAKAPPPVPSRPPVPPTLKTAAPPPNLPTVEMPVAPRMAAAPPLPSAPPVKPAPAAAPPIPAAPSPAAPKPVPPSAPPPPARPSMSDVAYTPKLVGPVEELRALTLVDFRRLSKDPKEATLKLKDKVDLLASQSFENKAKATKAWQESEPNRIYLELLKRSLEGRPVVELIAEKQAKNEPVLTKPEFDAVMAFNRQLRFG